MDADVGRIVVRPSVVQRRYFVVLSAAFTAMLVVGIVMSLHAGSFAASKRAALGPALAFVGAIVVVGYALPRLLGRTVVTGDGISTTGALLIRRSCRWPELKKIETRQQANRSGFITRVVVHRADGRRIQLTAPWTGHGVLRDPDFHLKLVQIMDYYTSVTGLTN